MLVLVSWAAGLIFGIGLVVSQMINPAKVLNFLDVTGTWDPSLAFVMAGAIPIAAIGFALARRRLRPVLAPDFRWPQKSVIDPPRIVGAILFGIGWGLVGFCPGPAIAALGAGRGEALLFVAAMIAGMTAVDIAARIGQRRLSAALAD